MVAEVSHQVSDFQEFVTDIFKCGDGFYDQWGGPGYEDCDTQLNAGIQRLFYKNRYSMAVTSLNLYMVSFDI